MTTDAPKHAPKPQDALLFYATVLDEADLAAAMQVQGIDEEIAALRLRLREVQEKEPENTILMLKCANALVRATAARYRMSPANADALRIAMQTVLPLAERMLGPEEDI